MTFDIIISIHEDIFDLLAMEQSDIVSAIFKNAANHLANGGKVILQKQYSTKPPDFLYEFTNETELSEYKDKINELQIRLKRPQQIS